MKRKQQREEAEGRLMAKRGRGRPRKSISEGSAEFFKVYLPHLSCEQLLIPPDFVKDFKRTIKERVTLKNTAGKMWHVNVKETRDGGFLKNGWQSFVSYHGLKVGEFLVFQYDSRYSFIVKIFGTSGCKKKIVASSETYIKVEEDTEEEIEVKQSVREMVKFSDRKVAYSKDLPEFFKIYKPSLCSETMRIPPAFIDIFGGKIPTICTLKSPSGLRWEVDTTKINDHWFFQNGWPEFVHENSLEDGDFLTFCYTDYSTFCVKIFSPNGCTKRADNSNSINGEPTHNLQEKSKQNRPSKRNWRPKSSMSVNGNPSFSLVMKESYLSKKFLYIPMQFWQSYMGDCSGKVTLCVENDAWIVSLKKSDRVLFSQGCVKFMKDNSLQIGNLCTFQLIDRNDLVFKVTIDR